MKLNAIESLPSALRDWANGITALTISEITEAEKKWSISLVDLYADGIATKPEINEAWATWMELKADELDYLLA